MASQQSQNEQMRNEPPGEARAPAGRNDAQVPEGAMPGGSQPGQPTDQGLYRQPEGYLQPPLPPITGGTPSPAWQPGVAQQHRGIGHRSLQPGSYRELDWGPSEHRQAYGPAGFERGPSGAFYGGPYGRPASERKGPKDFVRSDERIREAVCERLFDQEWIDVSDVSVQVSDGCVRLEGTVAERRMKHAIEDIADSCLGVRDVDNRIRVRRFGEAVPEQGPQGDPQV